jgi:APA family basic amino acid/polyamine antiporter
MDKPAPLARILGLGFGLAMVFGGTVGVGILRLPGTLAATLGDSRVILVFWIVGGIYTLLGAVSVAELAAMLPRAGGFYVYARRAFGSGAGFVVGWSDWINEVAALAYGSITAMTFLAALWPAAASCARTGAVLIVAAFAALHWVGLRLGSSLTRLISLSIGLMMLILVVACFFVPPAAHTSAPLPLSAAALPLLSMGTLAALVSAMRNVLLTYDGWYSPIYLAEENTHPGRTLPRALIGGTLVLIVLYVSVNAALLRVLPLSALASSDLPAATAARMVFPHGGGELVTLISLLTVLSLVNATLLITPRLALAVSSAAAIALILSGTFEQIIALATVLFLLNYISAYAALFVLRRREPGLPRPYRAFGFPFTTAIVLVGSVLALIAAAVEDPRSALAAGLLLAACAPIYVGIARRRRRVAASAAAELP